jgi:hypothetical protein
VSAATDYYTDLLESAFDLESISILVAAGATQAEVAAALEIDITAPVAEFPDAEAEDGSAYALVDVAGGVLAVELSGYADPSRAALRELSSGGRSAAVVRSNIQAHLRFGCARDGELLFDDHEYMYVDDPEPVPAELKELFLEAWDDLEAEEPEPTSDGFAVALAMAEVVTGIRLTAADLAAVQEAGFRPAPSLRYVEGLSAEE